MIFLQSKEGRISSFGSRTHGVLCMNPLKFKAVSSNFSWFFVFYFTHHKNGSNVQPHKDQM